MTVEQATVVQALDSASFNATQIGVKVVFASDSLAGVVLGFEPGQSVPLHRHPHKDEVFDVVEGEGEIYVGDRWLRAGRGTMVHVPPGIEHGLRNTGSSRWILRETVRERVYARTALRLVGQAFLKRWGRVMGRLKRQ
ncbi:MAG: cupin domain-containing protein [Chloroflexi bacterium]|nr:cupin domain-containing protein [Chloroflexota bacterium]